MTTTFTPPKVERNVPLPPSYRPRRPKKPRSPWPSSPWREFLAGVKTGDSFVVPVTEAQHVRNAARLVGVKVLSEVKPTTQQRFWVL